MAGIDAAVRAGLADDVDELTAAGKARYRAAAGRYLEGIERHFAAGLASAELATLARALRKAAQHIEIAARLPLDRGDARQPPQPPGQRPRRLTVLARGAEL